MAIILSVFILTQSVGFGAKDILQLDELIEHAQFHIQEHGDNFLVFISKHYGELKHEHSQSHQEEQDQHEELPFQFQGQLCSIIAFVSHSPLSTFESIEIIDTTEVNFHYLNLYVSLLEKELLQPPKIG
jgi:hypothetical protein